ncbi:S-formylglutathione hydrolase [Marinobacter persicus]|uniref:S-formylglutathione hydrolase n=1 Tax=Marinobacter persicus TaxID=930118 RepID=A0A2S6G1U3_9GAMM|nr:S-formylglutathione hydrolase [Marinobacter persicus]PPK49812.1 S-formylglutathione hydrolase [Marinobacter persicus]PPK50891.1 S-formylglutathione hydrolase [Marinobacter persicus]PPK55405.1 S-formylglutathione hydrolase [Marinobacter persicus]
MSDTTPELLASNKCFGGWLKRYKHTSTATGTEMVFAIYLPPQAQTEKVPVLYWLSGLTCTDENFMQKAGAQRMAAELGIALVAPDTSPRGTDLPGEHDSYDFGSGAGFYVNATRQPWSAHYNMFDYVTEELPALVEQYFPVTDKRAISGHSMGGHGALICALKKPGRYRSVSAFAPITNPVNCPWGEKAFTGYLGDDREAWKAWDACELVATAKEKLPLLVDQGEADNFLDEQLKPGALEAACEAAGHPLELRLQPGYDHSYFFIASFIDDHLRHHARALG